MTRHHEPYTPSLLAIVRITGGSISQSRPPPLTPSRRTGRLIAIILLLISGIVEPSTSTALPRSTDPASLSTTPADSVPTASPCSHPLSLDTLQARMLSDSPIVAQIDAAMADQMAKALSVSTWTNPELQVEQTFTHMKVGGANDPQSNIALNQPLRLSDFGNRARVAELMRKAGSSEQRRQLLSLTQKLYRRAYTLSIVESVRARIESSERQARSYRGFIAQGVAAGLISVSERSLFEGEYHRLRAEKKGAEVAIISAQAELGELAGLSCLPQVASPPALPNLPDETAIIEMAQTSGLSDLDRSILVAELSYEEQQLAERDSLPGFAPRLVYQHTNDGGDFFGVGIALPLPVWNRNQAERTRATAQASAASRRSAFLRDGGFALQISALCRALNVLNDQISIIENHSAPAFRAALAAQEKLFQHGQGNILQLWQSLRASHEIALQELSLRLKAMTMRSRLSLLAGKEV